MAARDSRGSWAVWPAPAPGAGLQPRKVLGCSAGKGTPCSRWVSSTEHRLPDLHLTDSLIAADIGVGGRWEGLQAHAAHWEAWVGTLDRREALAGGRVSRVLCVGPRAEVKTGSCAHSGL